MEDTLSKFMGETAKIHEENSNLIKEIRASTDAAIRNQGASIKTLEIQIWQMSKVLQERGFGSLPSSTETNLRDQVKSISTTIEADESSIRRIGSNQYAVSTGQNSTLSFKSKQTMIPFPSRLDNHYCDEEEGSYGPKFMKAYGASNVYDTIPRKEKDLGSFTLPYYINDVCFDNSLVDLGASVSVMPLLTYLNLGLGELAHNKLTVELVDRTVKYPKGIVENVLVGIGKFTFPVDFIILDMPKDIKVPLILGRPFLSTARAKIDVYKRKITLRVVEERIIFKSVKPARSLIKKVYMLSLRERMELDLESRLMGETLVLNRSLDPISGDYIELNNLNVPIELRRDQVNDLIPTIKEGEVIEEFRARNDARMINEIFYPIMIDFVVLEDLDAYRDEGMGDVIVGEPFLREVGIKERRFDGMITIYNGNDEVTYQMVRSHPRVLYKVEDIAACLVEYVKLWDDWEVDRYGNANLAALLKCNYRAFGKRWRKGRVSNHNEEFKKVADSDINTLYHSRSIQALTAYEATRAANALEAKSQSQNSSDDDNGNGRNGNGGDGNGGNGNPNENIRDAMHIVRECTYQDFMKCQPLNFKGTKGVVGLIMWFEKMEIVFHISNCLEKYQVKYATCTLLNSALTWWNSHKRTVRTDVAFAMSWRELMKLMAEVYYPRNEIQKMESELWNLTVKNNDLVAYT
ncbi:mitochondrial proton/calcium exchanger protein-like protein isoform X1 [Tanacetum coccineum]